MQHLLLKSLKTRIAGTGGSAWIRGVGSEVFVADEDGTRTVPIDEDLQGGEVSPPPKHALESDYERMIGHGLDLGPYTRLAEHFRAQILDIPPPPGSSPADFTDGLAQMAVLDAARSSVRVGQWVDVALSD